MAPRARLGEALEAIGALALFVIAPLFVIPGALRYLQARPYGQRIRAHRIDGAWVEDEALVVDAGGERERVPFAELTPGAWTIVDWGGSFAAANECGLLVELRRRDRAAAWLGVEWLRGDADAAFTRPLIERGLLPPRPREVAFPGRFGFAVALWSSAFWLVLGALFWLG